MIPRSDEDPNDDEGSDMGGKQTSRGTRRQRAVATARARHGLRRGALALVASGVVVLPAAAQPRGAVEPPALDAPLALAVPWGARAAGLGGAFLAGDDADVLFHNPGALPSARGVSANVLRTRGAALGSSVAAVTTLGGWTVGAGARAMRLAEGARGTGPIVPLSEGTGAPDPTYGPWRAAAIAGSATLSVGAARRLGPARVGATVHAGNDVGPRSTTGDALDLLMAVDVGATVPAGPGAFALVARHIGPDPAVDGLAGAPPVERRLPMRYEVGYGVALSPATTWVDLGGQFAVGVDRDGRFESRGGLEAALAPVEGVGLLARVGSRRTDRGARLFWGTGVVIDRVTMDVAYEPDPAGAGWRIGLRVR